MPGLAKDDADDDEEGEEEETDVEESDDETRRSKRPRLGVPAGIHNMFRPTLENSAAHQGKVRRQPHVEGNYASLAYISVSGGEAWQQQTEACIRSLRRLSELSGNPGAEVLGLDPKTGAGRHVSLGPLVMLRRQFVDPFLERIKAQVAALGIEQGTVSFQGEVELLSSKQEDRFFAAVAVEEASAIWLRRVAECVHRASSELGLLTGPAAPATDMRLHCSLASTFADIRPSLVAFAATRRETGWGTSWSLQGMPEAAALPSLRLRTRATLVVRIGERVNIINFGTAASSVGRSVFGGSEPLHQSCTTPLTS